MERARQRRLLVAVIAAAGLGLLAWSWTRVDPVLALVFALAVLAAEACPVRIRHDLSLTLAALVYLTALPIGGPPLAVAAIAGVPFVAWRSCATLRVERTAFNTGTQALAAATAGLVYLGLGGTVGDVPGPWVWAALLAASLCATVVNIGLVAAVVRVDSLTPPRQTVEAIASSLLVPYVLNAGLAVLASALLLESGPVALALLVVPAAVARWALRAHQMELLAYDELVSALVTGIGVKDAYTAGHTRRVAELCTEVGRRMGLREHDVRALDYAARLHDIGKLAVARRVIRKPGPLDDGEWESVRHHPEAGARILAGIGFLEPALDGVRYHHERVDGAGYPHRVGGSALPLSARIITACDAFDAMTTTRSYRRAVPVRAALEELRRCAGTQFDRDVVAVLAKVVAHLDWQPTYEPDRALSFDRD